MSLRQSVRQVGASQLTNWFVRHPRLTAMLLVLVVAIAMQGSVAALEGGDGGGFDWDVGTQDDDDKDSGP